MTDEHLQLAPDDEARIDAILRSMTDADLEFPEPPAAIWAAIESELGDEGGRSFHPVETPAVDESDSAEIIDLRDRFRRRPAAIALVAAAFALIVGVVVTSGPSTPDYEVVGEAELLWEDGFVADGTAAIAAASLLVADTDEAIRIDSASLPAAPAGEDLELWLIGVEADGELIIESLGVIDDPSDTSTYEVPGSFATGDYDTVLVDISFEPRDGNEAHSGASVIRGPLQSA